MVQMNRKGILATMVTILFILPLVLLVFASTSNVKITQSAFTDSESGLKMRFADEDISQDILSLVGYTSRRNATSVSFCLTGLGAFGAPTAFENYSGFVNAYYNQQVNILVGVNGSVLPLTVSQGYMITKGSGLTMAPLPATTPYDDLDVLLLTITTDKYAANLTANSTPVNNGPVAVDVILLDPAGGVVIDFPYGALDPAQVNAPFSASFSDGSGIDVTFGDIAGSLGTLTVQPSGLAAGMGSLTAVFNTTEPLHATTNATITILVQGSIHKQVYAHD